MNQVRESVAKLVGIKRIEFNLNTILLLIIILLLLVIAYSLYKPEGIVEMLKALYYTTNLG